MIKVNVEELKKLNYEDGKKLILANGYEQTNTGISEDSPSCDYISDEYFTLLGEDGEELHIVSYSQYMNKNDEPSNDDGSADIVVKEGWEEV